MAGPPNRGPELRGLQGSRRRPIGLPPTLPGRVVLLASCETAPSKRDQFRFPLTTGISGADQTNESAVSIWVVLSLGVPAPCGSREQALRVGAQPGSGLQKAQDGQHPSVVSV
jgi:hypothetical protein